MLKKINLLPTENDWRCGPFHVNRCLGIINGIGGLDLQSDGLSGYEDLYDAINLSQAVEH